MPSVTFQISSDTGFVGKFSDPEFWRGYRLYVLREITEKAMEVIRTHASTLWVNPTGALDQSWFSRYDTGNELGFISNSKPYAYWLNTGVRPHKMVYLLNSHNTYFLKDGTKAAVIPIRPAGKGRGHTVFRIATERQMTEHPSSKPWFHKGIAPKHFLEDGLTEYSEHHAQNDFEGLTVKILNSL